MVEIRLLTLTGPGGSGKTRLAIEVVQQLDDTHGGGSAWIDLAPIAEDSLVPRALARELGVPEQAERSTREAARGGQRLPGEFQALEAKVRYRASKRATAVPRL